MPGWGWVLIVVVVLGVVGVVAWQGMARKRTTHLRDRFGPEYDRVAGATEKKRDAEAELESREERREQLDIRPLSDGSRARYQDRWTSVQSQFVDDPRGALASAGALLQDAMSERGYPVEDFEQSAADVSVDHPGVVDRYREGHRLAQTGGDDADATENLRQAMQHYRAVFDDVVGVASAQTAA